MEQNILELVNISKSFDNEKVLNNLNLQIKENEFITLLGPSGCGKTTTLRIIGGFTAPESGRVLFEGKDITKYPPNKRSLNTVFQRYALFPNMNVEENIAFGLRVSKKPQSYIDDKIKYALNLVNLKGYEKRSVASLSGGQQQRIAIARAIVNEPKVLLLDEPLGALDLKLREEMQYELMRLKNELGITFVYVTHDQEEALLMSDKVVVMNQGYIQQMGTPEEIYNKPNNAFVATFIGDSNIFDGIVTEKGIVQIGTIIYGCDSSIVEKLEKVDCVIRPEDVQIEDAEEGYPLGTVISSVFLGVYYEMCVDFDGQEWLVQNTKNYVIGSKVRLSVKPDDVHIMKKPDSSDKEAMSLAEVLGEEAK